MNMGDTIPQYIGRLEVFAYDSDDVATRKLVEYRDLGTNLVTTVGKGYFLDAADGAAARVLSAAQGGLLIGTGTPTPAIGDTNLATSLYRAPMDAGFPTRSGVVATYQFTIAAATSAANGQHTEFGLTNASTTGLTDGVLITHLVFAGGFAKSTAVSLTYIYTLTQA